MDKRVIWSVILVCVALTVGGIWLVGKKVPFVPNLSEGKLVNEFLKVTANDWVKGRENARVTVIEYGDFQCPACGAYYTVMKQLLEELPDKVRVVFRQYPLVQLHDNAYLAAKAAEAAGLQGKFWEMHDKLFENQKNWAESKEFGKIIQKYAQDLGLDDNKFKVDLDDASIEAKVQNDRETGIKVGVSGTPSFFINGVKLEKLPGSYEAFKAVIEGEAAVITPIEAETVHNHADFALYSDTGKKSNFSEEKFMEKDPDIHFHDGNGDLIHVHKSGSTLGKLFKGLGEYLPAEAGWYVNGKKMAGLPENYVVSDLDRIVVVAMGVGETLSSEKLNTMVGDKACIYSEKCPERGKAPTEKCVGGLGTDCK